MKTNILRIFRGKSGYLIPIFFLYFSLFSLTVKSQGVGINSAGAPSDTSAMLDIKSTTKGLLIPRMTIAQRNAIVLPANGLLIYNTDCNNINYNAGTPTAPNWLPVNSPLTLSAPGSISGQTTVCQNQAGVIYSISPVPGALSYVWTVPSGATITSGQGGTTITVTFGTSNGDICVYASNNCGNSPATCTAITITTPPSSAFSWSPTSPAPSQTCTFTPSVTGAGYSWNFQGGSPSTSTVQNPSVTWASTGTFAVTLVVNQGGCVSTTTSNNLTVTSCSHGTVTFNANGSYNTGSVQTWTVPVSACSITIEAWGAQGGNTTQAGSKGARMRGDFSTIAGQSLSIIVGQQGESRSSYDGGGGGGTFVWLTSNSTPLIIAGGGGGGGGGNGVPSTWVGIDGVTSNNGTNGNSATQGAGVNGNGGSSATGSYWASGGSGWYSVGNAGSGCSNTSTGGNTPLSGGAGGTWGGDYGYNGNGGYGGGGGAQGACNCAGGGGGGGYSGGGPGANCNGGGGGGSYNTGTNQSNSPGIQTGNGMVTISW
ncbi:MAG: PKD domain-containing protein [Bacteroidota bacterium]